MSDTFPSPFFFFSLCDHKCSCSNYNQILCAVFLHKKFMLPLRRADSNLEASNSIHWPSPVARWLQRDVVYRGWPMGLRTAGAGGGAAGSQPMSTAVHITWHGAQIWRSTSILNLWLKHFTAATTTLGSSARREDGVRSLEEDQVVFLREKMKDPWATTDQIWTRSAGGCTVHSVQPVQ